MTTRRWSTLVVSVAVAAAALLDRVRRPGPLPGEEMAPSPPSPSATEEGAVALAPPTPVDVRNALTRAFSGCVAPAPEPESAVADFNRDGSEDVVVVVQPSEERSYEINDDLRNWIVQDLESERAGARRVRPARVEKGERLLAVIHGHGPAGWRSPQARQAYLLKHAAGSGLGFARTPRGDVIAEEVDRVPRHLGWTGAGYAWR